MIYYLHIIIKDRTCTSVTRSDFIFITSSVTFSKVSGLLFIVQPGRSLSAARYYRTAFILNKQKTIFAASIGFSIKSIYINPYCTIRSFKSSLRRVRIIIPFNIWLYIIIYKIYSISEMEYISVYLSCSTIILIIRCFIRAGTNLGRLIWTALNLFW